MNTSHQTRNDLRGIIEKALEDFSEQQVNLNSKAARDAIALRIASDIIQSRRSRLVND